MNLTTSYDLIVIGGGPAGCAAAITAVQAGASVLLLERGRYPRHKVCGEFVSAESVALLGSLLSGDSAVLFADAPRISQARLLKGNARATVPISPSAMSVPRYKLDDALFRAAVRFGVDGRQETAGASLKREEDSFVVTTATGVLRARAVIVAAGRWSNLRRPELRPKLGDEYIGIKAHFRGASEFPRDAVELHFFEAGYCGIDCVSEDVASVCAMVRPDVARSMEEVLSLSKTLSFRTRNWQPLFEPVTTFPLLFTEPEPERDGIVYAGDAAAFVDPFVGDGISLALQSGTLAASCLAPVFRGECNLEHAAVQYRALYKQRFIPVFRNAARIRRLLEMPQIVVTAFTQLLRMPFVSNHVIRLTRAA